MNVYTLTILDGANTSEALDITGMTIIGIETPDGIDAGSLGFKHSVDGTNFYPVRDSAAGYPGFNVVVDQFYTLEPAKFVGLGHIKLWMHDGSGSNAGQNANRVFKVVCRSIE